MHCVNNLLVAVCVLIYLLAHPQILTLLMIIRSVIPKEDRLLIEWADNTTNAFYYIWLYDNKPDRWHFNGQKLGKTIDIPVGIKPLEVESSPGSIHLIWPDGDTSYSALGAK